MHQFSSSPGDKSSEIQAESPVLQPLYLLSQSASSTGPRFTFNTLLEELKGEEALT